MYGSERLNKMRSTSKEAKERHEGAARVYTGSRGAIQRERNSEAKPGETQRNQDKLKTR